VRRLAAALLIVGVWFGCASREVRPAPLAAAPQADASERLRRDLEAIFTAPAIDHAVWGVSFQSLTSREILYSYNASRFLLPASNQKLFTSAVAAERLGWDYRFETRVRASGAVDASGTLDGDLIIVGSGDPTINSRHADRARAFDQWAVNLQARGIKAIAGRIVGDDNAFEEPGLGFGWAWDNLPYGYGTAVGALQYNENQFAVTIAPGEQPELPPVVTSEPPTHDLQVVSRVKTIGRGAESNLEAVRRIGSTVLELRGGIAANARPVSMTVSVENPTRFFLNALREALVRHGIEVADAVDIDDLPAPPDANSLTELFVDRSPPLSEIIDVCLKWSRNEYAETLLHAVAQPGKPATAVAGLDVMRAQLQTWGIAPSLIAPRDGSGLSRQDYVAPNAVIALLSHLWADPKHAQMFRSTLPVSGVSGSLADRMKGTPIEGQVWAKTGTLSNVRTLSGYLITRAGEPIVFSMMVNNFQVTTDEIDATMEKALLRVFQYRR
jgi:D-alanyl-D-alanine carboxypeptidase/D-alanyl-D-alanine-endopeptidase (penicillin-binding protein 4)